MSRGDALVEIGWPLPRPFGPPFGPGQGWTVVKAGRMADAITQAAYGGAAYVHYVLPPDWAGTDYADGLWRETVTLPHEEVEFGGKTVPAFEGDPERAEWERRRSR